MGIFGGRVVKNKEKIVTLKGKAKGITIFLKEEASIQALLEELEILLNESADFFNKVDVSIFLEGKKLNKLEYSQVVDIIINKTPVNCEKITADITGYKIEMKNKVTDEVEFYHGTLRAGQRVESDKNIIVMGDVNPSAEVVAKGNVIVLGSLKGTAWAGYPDVEKAFIVAFDMHPIMLKIGQVFGRADYHQSLVHKSQNPGISFLTEGQVTVEPLDYKAINNIANLKRSDTA